MRPGPPRPFQPATLLATGFGLGRLPIAPGTWASAFAALAAWPILDAGGRIGLVSAAIVALVLAAIALPSVLAKAAPKDPSWVVIDEIVGQWLALVVLATPDFLGFAIGFALFRLFDITKPWPCGALERLPGTAGVMLDDLAAGLYAGLALLVFVRLGL